MPKQPTEQFTVGMRVFQFAIILLLFIVLSQLLRPTLGSSVGILEVIPALVMGMWQGMWAGVTMSVLCAILDMGVLFPLAGISTATILQSGGTIGVAATIAIGAIVGRLRDLGQLLHVELSEREDAEERLLKAHQELERRVAERTAALRASEEHNRSFLREVLRTVTEGRLQVCATPNDLPMPLPHSSPTIPLVANKLIEVRSQLREIGERIGFPTSRLLDLTLGVGEGSMNAVVHGVNGEATICWSQPDEQGKVCTLQVWITDHGKGIDENRLHLATLEDGYTTAGTLGRGFGILLRTVDRVWLLTGPRGTTVVLEQNRNALDSSRP